METEFIKDLFLINRLVSFVFDVARLALGFGIGMYLALRCARIKMERV